MTRMSFVTVTLLLSLLCCGIAAADTESGPGPYVGGSAGVMLLNDNSSSIAGINSKVSWDPGFTVNAFGGYDFGYLRLEGELSYRGAAVDKLGVVTTNAALPATGAFVGFNSDMNINAFSGLANAWIDIKNPSIFTPYFGGGGGFASAYLTGGDWFDHSSSTKTVFAYQVGGGALVRLTPRLDLDLSYRYFGTEKFNVGASWWYGGLFSFSTKMQSSNIGLGVRYVFR